MTKTYPQHFSNFIQRNVPPECLEMIDGTLVMNELGVIHLVTAVEQMRPEDPRIRAARYYLQKIAREVSPRRALESALMHPGQKKAMRLENSDKVVVLDAEDHNLLKKFPWYFKNGKVFTIIKGWQGDQWFPMKAFMESFLESCERPVVRLKIVSRKNFSHEKRQRKTDTVPNSRNRK